MCTTGPNIASYGIALVEREVAHVQQLESTTISDHPHVSAEEQLAVLGMAREVMSRLDGTLIDRFSQPVLWHTDLHMGNIFVSAEEPTKIVSIINWQSTSILPLYLQVRFPGFLSVDEDFILDSPIPELPQDYATMNAADKQLTVFKLRQARMAKAYEVATSVHNPQAYKAMFMPSFLQEIFTRCGESSEGIIPLCACLIQLAETWDNVGFRGECPFSFSDADIQTHNQQFQQYRDFHSIQEIARKLLDTDSEGWVSPQIDFALKVKQNRELLDEVVRRSSEFNKSPEEVRRIWPFHELEGT